jgi:hypothetical protein
MSYTTPASKSTGDTLSAVADWNTGVRENMEELDRRTGGSALVSALPGSPVDREVAYYQNSAMVTEGIVWAFRYNAATTIYPWHFIGGGPWSARILTQEGTASTAYTNLATIGPNITVPLDGVYELQWGSWGQVLSGSGQSFFMSVALGGLAASDNWVSRGGGYAAGVNAIMSHATSLESELGAGNILEPKYRSSNGAVTANFGQRWLNLLPKRVRA